MINQLKINKMRNLYYKVSRNGLITLQMLFITCFLLLTACDQGGQQIERKEQPVKTYKDYSYDEFIKLPHDVQYSLKFPEDNDTIVSIEYGWVDTSYNDDGTPASIDFRQRTCPLVLESDTMKFYYPYSAKPTFRFNTNKNLYDKRTETFTNRFEFSFIKNKSKGYYYIVKSVFPSNLCSDNSYQNGLEGKLYVDNLEPTDLKYKKLVGEIENNMVLPFFYGFSESHYIEGTNTWYVEENEITKFKNWLRR